MFRVSRFMEALRDGTPIPPAPRKRRGHAVPAVIWHPCQDALTTPAPGSELDTHEALSLLDQLHATHVRSLILSGNEPMTRPDFFRIVARARELGLRVALSTDGSRLTAMSALKLAAYRVDYVGIQIEGLQPTHNHIRRSRHAYQRALRGLGAARNAGLQVGMHMALNTLKAAERPAIVALAESESLDRFHLTQAPPADCPQGGAPCNAPQQMTLAALEWLFDHVWKRAQKGDAGNFVTSRHAADRVYLLYWMITRMPNRLPELRERIDRSAATKHAGVLNIDPFGNVRTDTTGLREALGNVREQRFSDIADIAARHPRRS